MRNAIARSLGLLVPVALVAALWLHVPWESVVTTGLVVVCLGWLVVVMTLPWNLYFQAKAVLFEMQRSRERGLSVRVDREAEARSVATRMLRFSIGLHLGSAVLAAGVTALERGHWGYVFSGFYLLSGFFRPGVEYYRYLRQRLGHLSAEVRFPPDDVKALQAEVLRLGTMATAATKVDEQLGERLTLLQRSSDVRQKDLDRRVTSLARTFEDTVNRLTDNQQIIGGIKAFLRLVKQDEVTES